MRLLTYLALTTLLFGCGEVSYKRGGSPQDIERAHQACRGSGEQLSNCLAEKGWQKPKADALDPLFATIKSSDNRADLQAKPSPFIELSEAPPPKKTKESVAKTPQPSETKTESVKPAAVAEAPLEERSAPQSTANDGPDVEYSINSWWKMGAFPDQLKRDQVACEKKLGPAYLPDYKTQTYKRAFVACMHDSGWMAIRNIK